MKTMEFIPQQKQCDTKGLVQRLKTGDKAAFNIIYQLFSRPLYRYIIHLSGDENSAKDLLQDLFMKLWVKHAQLDPQLVVKPYLYRMATNLTMNYYRRVVQNRQYLNWQMNFAANHIVSIEQTMIDKETIALVKLAISKLPRQRQNVFTLCKLDGKSYAEVSSLLGISNATVNDHIAKANKALKASWSGNR
jgi:RNA polymerase sigma-70 factor (ECF subfamily)